MDVALAKLQQAQSSNGDSVSQWWCNDRYINSIFITGLGELKGRAILKTYKSSHG